MGYEEENEEERFDLCAQVKQIQRDSEDGKQQWWAFCDAEGHSNRRDPNKHNVAFLRRFFENRREGLIPIGRVSLAPQHEPDPEMHKIWVQRVKQTQRSSPDMKVRWEAHCDENGNGVRDPQRHTSEFMRAFFDDFGGYTEGDPGAWPQATAGQAYPYAGWTPEAAWAHYYAQCGYAMPAGMQPGAMPGQALPDGTPAMPGPMPGGTWGGVWGGNGVEKKEGRRSASRSRSRDRSSEDGRKRKKEDKRRGKSRRKKGDKKSKEKSRKKKKRRKRSRSSSSSSSSSRSS